ncbi:unnamed protein product [Ostreobium quekettii]|uniref:Vanadium-dependent haloperoxidase NapH1-like second helical-bundle domain-containing protein n=1 Tax=Ostreobium quekettii TaxID=121088 RepID=A0A8S1JFT7_9CHLO|nr:unnamed protein product [Ostreobium quekettii]|eukprot:evm.model.scf_268.1 EVM.evm.TU.scf_268.1   scf_268:8739-12874(-)
MDVRAALKAALLLGVLLCAQAQEAVYSREECPVLCTNEKEFETPLPEKPKCKDEPGARIQDWATVMLNQVKNNVKELNPPGVGRLLGIFSACVHDAAALGSPKMTPFYSRQQKKANDLANFEVEAAIDGAAFEALRSMFSEFDSFGLVVDFMRDLCGSSKVPKEGGVDIEGTGDSNGLKVTTRPFQKGELESAYEGDDSFALGNATCRDVIAAYTSDGFDTIGRPLPGTVVEAHVPFNEPQVKPGVTDCAAEIKSLDRWQPLCVPVAFMSEECNVQKFLAPTAREWHTFGLPSGDFLRPDGPPSFDTDEAEWRRQAFEVVEFSANLSDLTKMVAEHWADGPDSTTPPGHWYRIALEAAEVKELDLFETAKVIFLTGISLADAGVAAWDTKITFDHIRPITMIQCGYGGDLVDSWVGPYQGVAKNREAATWQPYQATTFVTPAFGGYISGHSTFSAASGGALDNFFGTAYVAPKCRRITEGSSLFEGRIDEGEPGFVEGLTNVPNKGPRTTGYAPATDVVLCWTTWDEAVEEAGISRLAGGIHIIADHTDGITVGKAVADLVYEKAKKNWM